MLTIHITFRPSSISEDHWLADEDELDNELKRIMPDVRGYSSRGFVDYKGYQIEKIFRCYNTFLPGPYDGQRTIELNVIPKNL